MDAVSTKTDITPSIANKVNNHYLKIVIPSARISISLNITLPTILDFIGKKRKMRREEIFGDYQTKFNIDNESYFYAKLRESYGGI